MIVKLASPELSVQHLQQALPPDIVVETFDESVPLVEQVAEAEVLVPRSIPITKQVIDAAPKLKLIQRPGAKVYVVDVEYAASKGIPVCIVPMEDQPSGGISVAEHALFLMLAVYRRLNESMQAIQTGTYEFPTGRILNGKTLGILGVGGRIGRHLAAVAGGVGMRVIGTELHANRELESELSLDWLGTPRQLEAMLGQCDVVSIQVPMSEETRSLIDRQAFGWMKTGAVLINTARAPIVDYDALHEALSSGRLAGAGLGVWWTIKPNPQDPLLDLHNVIYMSQTGSLESAEEKARAMVDNIIAVREGRAPGNMTNFRQRER